MVETLEQKSKEQNNSCSPEGIISLSIKKIEKTPDKQESIRDYYFCDNIFDVGRYYFNELVENPKLNDPAKYSKPLQDILKAMRIATSEFYEHEKIIHKDPIKELILKNKKILVGCGIGQNYSQRHLGYSDRNMTREACNKAYPGLEEKSIDLIIPISSGGFESSALISDYLGIDNFFPIRYSHLTKDDSKVLIPNYFLNQEVHEKINNKNVLIVDDIIDGGTTIGNTLKWIKPFNPKKIYTMAINGSWLMSERPAPIKKICGKSEFLKINDDVYECKLNTRKWYW